MPLGKRPLCEAYTAILAKELFKNERNMIEFERFMKALSYGFLSL